MTGWLSWLAGPYVHHIDPVMFEVAGVYFWYYGLSYSLGFLGVHWWLRRARGRLGLSTAEVYDLTISVALGVLVTSRLFEVAFYEWPYYRRHPLEIFNYWQGGLSSHGILLGAVLAAWWFCRRRGKGFLAVADELTIPGALLLAVGRLGNFVDGQIIGSVTDVWWAVKFPDAEGFRHPVVLYDGLKNLLIIPILILARRQAPAGRGGLLAHFVFWYGALRLVVDHFRQYPVAILGVGTGQYFNLAMLVGGLALLVWERRRGAAPAPATPADARVVPAPSADDRRRGALLVRRMALAVLVAFPLVIPSDWTQDVPERYGKRHPIRHSLLYRSLDPDH